MLGMNRAQMVLARFDDAEYRLCRGLNRAAEWLWLRNLMRMVSRLGDGVLWYSLLVALPLVYGTAAIRVLPWKCHHLIATAFLPGTPCMRCVSPSRQSLIFQYWAGG